MKQQQDPPRTIRDYVYSSEIKTRDKFTINHLLPQESSLLRNYASQQSQRMLKSAGRPQTMYGDRVRTFLNTQIKKTKMQTQIKIRRQQSSYKVARSSSGTQVKMTSQQDKIRMKKALGKVNILASGEGLDLSQQQQIQSIFAFLGCLAEANNHYQTAFRYLFRKLKQLVFANNKSQLGSRIHALASRSKNQFLINFIYRNLGKTTFEDLCKQLLEQADKSVARMHKAQSNQTSNQSKYEDIIKEKQQMIRKLKRQLKYYQQHPSQDLYPYVKKLERDDKQMKEEVDQLLRIKRQNQYSIQVYQTANLLLSEQVQSLKGRIYEMELEELSGLKQVEKNSQLKIFQENVDNLKQMLDKSKLKMQGMKEQFDKLKAYNQQLINERSLLAKRAAVGFGELTPRPNVKNIFTQNGLFYENIINLPQKSITTQNIMRVMAMKIKQSFGEQTKKMEKVQIVKLQQADEEEDKMLDALKYLDQTKMQVSKTIKSVQDVKKSFNKQSNDKEELEKAKTKI